MVKNNPFEVKILKMVYLVLKCPIEVKNLFEPSFSYVYFFKFDRGKYSAQIEMRGTTSAQKIVRLKFWPFRLFCNENLYFRATYFFI